MSAKRMQTLQEIRQAGIKALALELGVVGMIRFLQQFESGTGNYTIERHNWLGDPSVQDVAEEIERRRATSSQQDI